MPGTQFEATKQRRRGSPYAADMAAYVRLMAETNDEQVERLKANLVRALNEEVTERQREVLLLYYDRRLAQKEIAALLGIDRSTVSRTMKRGEKRLRKCLRYGMATLLPVDEDNPE